MIFTVRSFRPSLRRRIAAVIVASSLAVMSPQGAAIAQDHPEPVPSGAALPGQTSLSWGSPVLPKPYQKGVRVIGHEPLGGRRTNQQLVWIDHCAYVASAPMLNSRMGGGNATGNGIDEKEGVAVVDMRDPAKPRQVGLLRERGALRAVETIAAVSAPGRKVLAAGDYAGGNPGFAADDPPALAIYDANTCTKPKLMAEYVWPENVHTLTISADGKRIYAPSVVKPPYGTGGIHVLDISDLRRPRYMGRFQATGSDGRSWDFGSHELWVSPDQRRIYAGVIHSLGGDLNGGLAFPREDAGGAEQGAVYILDNSDIADGKPDPKIRLVGTAHRAGWHNVVPATFGGVPYIVASAEAGRCPGSFPRITRISDERKPVLVGEFRLSGNHLKACDLGVKRNAVANTHFTDVDDAEDTRFGLFNFEAAGLRIADLRDPRDPVEIAYFRPGDSCTGHVRYDRKTDQIWVTCQSSGLWVLQLSPEVRASLNTPRNVAAAAK